MEGQKLNSHTLPLVIFCKGKVSPRLLAEFLLSQVLEQPAHFPFLPLEAHNPPPSDMKLHISGMMRALAVCLNTTN